MFSKTASLDDLIYTPHKDYRGEARQIAELVGELKPGARRMLDVACGSGEHARFLAEDHGYVVDGLDLEPAFIEIARRKVPCAEFTCGDMRSFALDKRYDVVLCLFSSIGYMRTLDNVRRALLQFRAHLAPKGLLIVEPWFEPEAC